MNKAITLIIGLFLTLSLTAQENQLMSRIVSLYEKITIKRPEFNADSVRRVIDNRPYFTMFKDNYFLGGFPVNKQPTDRNSDVKFQLSISQRITKSKLPFDTYLFIAYTQKAFWNVFQESLPMQDLNYNPGIGLAHLIIHKNKYIGKAMLLIEHESNGKDSIWSRSWNKITLGASVLVNKNLEMQFKTWIPIIDSDNNRDLLKYAGVFQLSADFMTNSKNFSAAAIVTKRQGWDLNFNTVVELSYKFRKKENQYFFLQFYNGYAENLLNYNKFTSMLRLGFVIKPNDFSFY
jgi:phospholipase A1